MIPEQQSGFFGGPEILKTRQVSDGEPKNPGEQTEMLTLTHPLQIVIQNVEISAPAIVYLFYKALVGLLFECAHLMYKFLLVNWLFLVGHWVNFRALQTKRAAIE